MSFILFLSLVFLSLSPLHYAMAVAPLTEEEIAYQTAHNYLALHDPKSGYTIVQQALKKQPTSESLLKMNIQCLAGMDEEKGVILAWKEFCQIQPERAGDVKLLEEIAWTIIRKNITSSAPLVRLEAISAAFFSQDAKGIPLVIKGLHDPCVEVRLFTLSLAANLKDELIIKETLLLAENDPSPFVRRQALATLGAMQAEQAKELLKKYVESPSSTSDLQLVAIASLAQITPVVERAKIEKLVKSETPYLRAFACELVLTQEKSDCLDLLIPLVQDRSVEVQTLALQTMAALGTYDFMRTPELSERLSALSNTSDARGAILGSYLLLQDAENSSKKLKGEQKNAQEIFSKWISCQNPQHRYLAAGALSSSGEAGVALSYSLLRQSQDPFVRANLAIGLIRERKHVKEAAAALEGAMQRMAQKIDWCREGTFTYVAPTLENHHPYIPRYLEAKDLLCRLMLLSVLASCDNYDINPALRLLLKERTWGICGATISLLLQEGDHMALDVIKGLLHDESLEIRLQAAFILVHTTQDLEALALLESAYKDAPRELKEHLLIGIGALGNKTSPKFLSQILCDPFPVLRLRAASAILQCLNS